ncbi:MAG: hypothetical protein HQK49_06380 [Oligoflexia bacterium]|nr:hypothetical protein [Oligoflexia bacterium]
MKKFILTFLFSTLVCGNLYASLANPCGDDRDAQIEVVSIFKIIEGEYSCSFPKELHCVKNSICPNFAMPADDTCAKKYGQYVQTKVTWKLEKINDKYSCFFPTLHCIDQNKCPMYSLMHPQSYCDKFAPGSEAISGSELRKIKNDSKFSCYHPTIHCVDKKRCPIF